MYTLFTLTNPAISNNIGSYDFGAGVTPQYMTQLILRNLINTAFVIAVVYFFIQVLLGGLGYISAGGEKESIQKAGKQIVNALIGIAITFSVYAIAWTVGTIFGIQLTQLNIPSLNP